MDAARPRLTWTLIAIVGFLTLCPVAMLLLGSFSEGLNGLGQQAGASWACASLQQVVQCFGRVRQLLQQGIEQASTERRR